MNFDVAVYGTLKLGGSNHGRFMSGYLSVRRTTIRGRLRKLSATIPILSVPPEDILARRTYDPVADAAALARIQEAPRPEASGEWEEIPAEVYTFDDPEDRLPDLDSLEGFRPGVRCLYERVVVRTADGRPVWIYIEPRSSQR